MKVESQRAIKTVKERSFSAMEKSSRVTLRIMSEMATVLADSQMVAITEVLGAMINHLVWVFCSVLLTRWSKHALKIGKLLTALSRFFSPMVSSTKAT